MADWFNAIGKPYETIVTEVMSHYRELNLRRTPEGMAGRNMLMEEIRRRQLVFLPHAAEISTGRIQGHGSS